jgi:hypothetical protein
MQKRIAKLAAIAALTIAASLVATSARADLLLPTRVVRTNLFALSQTAVSLDAVSIAYLSTGISGEETARAGVGYSAAVVGGLLMIFSVHETADRGQLFDGADLGSALTSPLSNAVLGAATLGLGLAALFPAKSALGEVVDQVLAARVSVSPSIGSDATGAPTPGLDVSVLL